MSATKEILPLSTEVPDIEERVSPKIERTLQQSIYEGCATIVFMSWTSGAVLTGYLVYLGASAKQLALISTIPLLGQAMAPFAAWLQSIFPRPKLIVTIGAIAARLVWLIPAIVPFFLDKDDLKGGAATMVLLLLAFTALFNGIIGVIWASWMGAVVPPSRRGSYFGLRNGIHSVIGVVSSIIGGLLLDRVGAPWNFQIIFFVAVIFAAVGIAAYQTHYEPPGMVTKINLKESFTVPFRDKNFRRYLGFAVYWQASLLIGMTLVFPYFINHLQLTFTQIAIFQVIAAITTLVMAPVWGRVADRVGNKAVLTITTMIAGTALPLCWLLATPGDPTMVWVSGFVDGLAFSAINAGIFNLSLATATPRWRTAYIGVMAMTTGIAGFIGGFSSAQLFGVIENLNFSFVGIDWTAYHLIFIISGVLRFCSFYFIARIEETHAWRTRDVIRAIIGLRSSGFPWR